MFSHIRKVKRKGGFGEGKVHVGWLGAAALIILVPPPLRNIVYSFSGEVIYARKIIFIRFQTITSLKHSRGGEGMTTVQNIADNALLQFDQWEVIESDF